MKASAIALLLAFVITFAGCGAAEEPVENTESELAVEVVDLEEVVEIDEEAVVNGQLPDPWPQDLFLAEGMEVILQSTNEEGYPLLVTQFAEGTEPHAVMDVFDYYRNLTASTDWTTPLLEENESLLTSTGFRLNLYHPDHNYILVDGSSDVETGVLTVEFLWYN